MSYVYNIVTPLRELTCHVGSHSATCHLTELTFPPLPQPKLVLDVATPGACQDLHAVHILDRLNVIRKEASRDATAGYHYFSNLLLLLLLLLSIAGLPRSTIAPLQRVQNAAAHLVARLGPRNHVTPTLKDRHWLPVEQRIVFKLCLLMHQVHTGRAPSYLHNCVSASADITSRPRLRSACSRRYERQRTRLKFGERSLSCAGPRAWNSLPSSLHELTH